mmetsp:Transcript_18397/g.39765  ORF Transcript_18397/g.39765 Transcript_18397/m.39765 type:complete len:505 (+) Transcript_18397:191-1705(+)
MSDHEEDGEDVLQFGESVVVLDEQRRMTEAETEQFDSQCKELKKSINEEGKVEAQHDKKRSKAEKDMKDNLTSQHTTTIRIGMGKSLLSSLCAEISAQCDLFSVGGSSQSTLLDLSTEDGSSTKSISSYHEYIESVEHEVSEVRVQLETIRKKIEEDKKVACALIHDEETLGDIIVTDRLEERLAHDKDATATKKEMLNQSQRRHKDLELRIQNTAEQLEGVKKKRDALKKELSEKQKDTAQKLATGNQGLSDVEAEESRLEDLLKGAKDHNDEVKRDLEALEKKDAELAKFIKNKEHKSKQQQEHRAKRQTIYSKKQEVETKTAELKSNIESLNTSLTASKEDAEKLDKKKSENEQFETEVLKAKSNLVDVMNEKEASQKILDGSKENPIVPHSFRQEANRISELRTRRDNIRKDFESKSSQLRAIRGKEEKAKKESKIDLDKLRKISSSTAELLQQRQGRLEELRARRKEREERFRSLEVIRHGASLLDEATRFARESKVFS